MLETWWKMKNNDGNSRWGHMAFLTNLAGVLLFQSEMQKAGGPKTVKKRQYPTQTQAQNQNTFPRLPHLPGWIKSYVHFLSQGAAGTCWGSQGYWWIPPGLSLPAVEWLYLLFHTAVCTSSLAGPGSGKDQPRKQSVQPTVSSRLCAQNYWAEINSNQWKENCFSSLGRKLRTFLIVTCSYLSFML